MAKTKIQKRAARNRPDERGGGLALAPPQAVRMTQLAGMMNAGPQQAELRRVAGMIDGSPLQMKTEVNWQSQNFRYKDKDDKKIKQKEVGGVMEATLDPSQPIKGSDARSSFQRDMYNSLTHYWNPGAKYWVRGHLLNANLGGPNVAPNLFPITGHANGDHLNYVENHVKKWVIGGEEVLYRVTARQEGGNITVGTETDVPNAAGSFECYAETTADKNKKVVHRLVNSVPVKRNSPGGGSIKTGHTSNWVRNPDVDDQKNTDITLNDSQINFLLALIQYNGSYRAAIKTVLITLDDLAELQEAIDSYSDDSESSLLDNVQDKVSNRVTNAKLKSWIKKSLTLSEAEDWLSDNKVSDGEYKVSS